MRALSYIALVAAVGLGCSPGGAAAPGPSATPPAAAPAAAGTPASGESSAEAVNPASTRSLTPPAEATVGPSASEPAAAARAPEAPPAPAVREVTIPAETSLSIALEGPVGSDTSAVEDPVRGTLTRPIVVNGHTIVPVGAEVRGSVIEAHRSGRVKGRASVAFRFDHLMVHGERYAIRTGTIAREAASSTGSDVKKGGIGAAAGAVIGGLAGGGRGAAIGAGVGGTGAVLATRGKEIRLAAGTAVSTRLQQPLTVTVAER